MSATSRTVIEHVLSRLEDIGITDIFGVPGDYSFPVNDAICHRPGMRWVGCSNELNAAYAADGYARIRGCCCGLHYLRRGRVECDQCHRRLVRGAPAGIHLVGTPNASTQAKRALMHHTLGNGEYDLFRRMSEPVVAASAIMTPDNAAYETERLIYEAFHQRRPVYMAFPADLANQPLVAEAAPLAMPRSQPEALEKAAGIILERLARADSACVLAGILVGPDGKPGAPERNAGCFRASIHDHVHGQVSAGRTAPGLYRHVRRGRF